MSNNKGLVILAILSMGLGYAGCAYSGSIHESLPNNIDPEKRYLFFLHGKIIEKKGVPARSKKYGSYEYREMLKTFSSGGFEVISETRGKYTDILEYSSQVAADVEKLIGAGVPGKNITVSGFSKGGRMTLVVSSLLGDRNVNYVILAGCRSTDIDGYDLRLVGRVLSIYDSNDDKFESCSEIFSAGGDGLEANEIVLSVGDGHGVFYRPLDEWVKPMIEWAKQ